MSERARVLELDGLRGLAILAVLVFHFAHYHPAQPDLLSRVIDLGWSGVDLFFVLSGFLITGVLLQDKGSERYLRNFFIRRGLRILPLYYLAVLLFFQLELPLAHHFQVLKFYRGDGELFYWFHLSNWRSAFGELAASPVGPFWSLAIEEQFYLVWPFAVLLTSRASLAVLCGLLAIASVSLRSVPAFQAAGAVHEEFLYRLTPFRLEPLCYGALIALVSESAGLRRRALPWFVVACIAGAATAGVAVVVGGSKYSNPAMAGYGVAGFDLLWAGVVGLAVVGQGGSGLAALLRARVLRRFGKYSYAMYVWHMQLATVLLLASDRFLPASAWTSCATVVVGVSCTYVVGAASWRWIEAPLLSLKERWAPAHAEPGPAIAGAPEAVPVALR